MTLATVRDFKQTLADAKETGVLFVIIQRRGAYRKIDARLEASEAWKLALQTAGGPCAIVES